MLTWRRGGSIVKYEADKEQGMSSLAIHRDGALLSFNILLNPETDFVGGHTYFEALRGVVPIRQGTLVDEWVHGAGASSRRPAALRCTGDIVIHCSKLRHGGHRISAGT